MKQVYTTVADAETIWTNSGYADWTYPEGFDAESVARRAYRDEIDITSALAAELVEMGEDLADWALDFKPITDQDTEDRF